MPQHCNLLSDRTSCKIQFKHRCALQDLAKPTLELKAKIARARQLGRSRDIWRDGTAFDSASTPVEEVEADSWDAKFRESQK